MIAEPADVSSIADLDRLFDLIERKWGGIDVLVNNAGVSGPRASIDDTDGMDGVTAWTST
jgi:NAD(P)-dependent dehydrogenase (short-subunit alcohol dehydrogenase family)